MRKELHEVMNGGNRQGFLMSEIIRMRDLSDSDVEYLFLDAIYGTLRKRYGMKEAVLCAWGILRTGEKVIGHLGLGNKESYEDWLEFLRDMVSRGFLPALRQEGRLQV